MKFLCIQCDHIMAFAERQLPGDGTLAAVFECSACGRDIAMLTNPMETQLVSSMGIEIGGRTVPEQSMELVRSNLEGGRQDAFVEEEPPVPARPGRVEWTPEAVERLGRVPSFVRGMVKRIYTDYARERGIGRMTPEVMDTARSDLGLEGM